MKLKFIKSYHCVKSVRIRSYSDPCFPAFGLITERYSVSLRIQSECGKIQTRITPNADTFYAAYMLQYTVVSLFSDVSLFSSLLTKETSIPPEFFLEFIYTKKNIFTIRKDRNFCDQILQAVVILDKKLKIFIFIFFQLFFLFLLKYFRIKYSTRPWLSNNIKFIKF